MFCHLRTAAKVAGTFASSFSCSAHGMLDIDAIVDNIRL
jgi:hypothetical protein